MRQAIPELPSLSGVVAQLQAVAHELEHAFPAQLRQIDAMIVAGEREILRLQRMLEVTSRPPVERSVREPDILPFDRSELRSYGALCQEKSGVESGRRAA